MPCYTCCALALVLAAAARRCCAGRGLLCRWGLHAVGSDDALRKCTYEMLLYR